MDSPQYVLQTLTTLINAKTRSSPKTISVATASDTPKCAPLGVDQAFSLRVVEGLRFLSHQGTWKRCFILTTREKLNKLKNHNSFQTYPRRKSRGKLLSPTLERHQRTDTGPPPWD